MAYSAKRLLDLHHALYIAILSLQAIMKSTQAESSAFSKHRVNRKYFIQSWLSFFKRKYSIRVFWRQRVEGEQEGMLIHSIHLYTCRSHASFLLHGADVSWLLSLAIRKWLSLNVCSVLALRLYWLMITAAVVLSHRADLALQVELERKKARFWGRGAEEWKGIGGWKKAKLLK